MVGAMSQALKESGFEVKIITYADNPMEEPGVIRIRREQNIFVRYVKYFAKMFRLALWADVLYVTDIYSVGYFAYLIKKIIGKKYIVRFAGDSAWETAAVSGLVSDYITDFEDKKYSKAIEEAKNRRRRVLINADKIIAVSDFLNSFAQKIGAPKEKVVTIYNSVDFQIQGDGVPVDFKKDFGEDAKVMICSSRLVPWKGVDTVIKIMPSLINEIKNIHLVILGDGPQMNELVSLTGSLGIGSNVHFLGRVKQEETPAYIKSADVFVLNTYYEGLSHVLLEAMRAGTPIVTTGAGGNPEVITDGENGILVEYNNEEQLRNGIKTILGDSKLAASFVANSKESLKRFDWEKTKSETIKVINNLQ